MKGEKLRSNDFPMWKIDSKTASKPPPPDPPDRPGKEPRGFGTRYAQLVGKSVCRIIKEGSRDTKGR